MKKLKLKIKILISKILSYALSLEIISMAQQMSFARKVAIIQTTLNLVNYFQAPAEPQPLKVDLQEALVKDTEEKKPKAKPLSKWLC